MRTILALFGLFFAGCIFAAIVTPPSQHAQDEPCTPTELVNVVVGGVVLSIPSAMQPDFGRSNGRESVRTKFNVGRNPPYDYCKEQAAYPLVTRSVSLSHYPDGRRIGPEMPAIHIIDNPGRAEGERALLELGSIVGPIFFSEPTAIYNIGGPIGLYRINGRFDTAQVIINISSTENFDPIPVLRAVEDILIKLKTAL